MKQIETEIRVAASPEEVWAVLQDFGQYSTWNPFIVRIQGSLQVGKRLEVHIQPPGGREMTFKPVVLEAEEGKILRWKGVLGIPGLFDGEHYFKLEALEDGGTRFVQGEVFTGILVPFIPLNSTRAGFEKMNESLSKRLISLTH